MKCEQCRDSGWIVDEHDRAYPCACRRQRIREGKIERIDRRFRHASFANYHPQDDRQVRTKQRMATNPAAGYFIAGPYGTGKTHLLVSQYRALLEAKACELRSAREITEEFRLAEMGEFSVIVERARNIDNFHLFIDDLDKIRRTEFRDEMLFDLIDTLYRRDQGLSVTSNCTIDQLERDELLPPGVVRRIRDMSVEVVL